MSTIVSYTTDLQSRGTNFWDILYFSRALLFQVNIKSGLIFPT